jgi:hypothetical protein
MNRPSNFADRPSRRKFRLQLGPWRHGRRWELNSGEGKARLGRERVGECSGAHRGSICGRRRGGKALGGGLQRWPAVLAAGTPVPVEGRRRRWCPTTRGGSGDRRVGAWGVPWRRNHARLALGVGVALAGPAACALHENGRCASWLMRGMYRQAQRWDTSFNAAVRRPASTCVRREPASNSWTSRSGRVRRRTRSHVTGSRSQATGARGTGGSRLETVGHGPARTSRWRGGRRVAQPGRQNARRAGGALERDCAVFQPVNATLTACFSKKLNCATKMIDMKVVDETSLYNICKGHPMFFSTV